MAFRFDGKRALVTGAGRGIGRAIAKNLSECGAQTVALSRSREPLEDLKAEVPDIEIVDVDVIDWPATKRALQEIGPVDLLVNNAGTSIPKSFLSMDRELVDTLFDLNIKSVFSISQVVAKGMVDRGRGGAIVNVSSTLSNHAIANCSAYCATKGAMDSLTQAMAFELGPHKIRVNAVNPGAIRTDLTKQLYDNSAAYNYIVKGYPIGRLGEPEDVVAAVLFLLSDQAAFITGITMPIDGGRSCHL